MVTNNFYNGDTWEGIKQYLIYVFPDAFPTLPVKEKTCQIHYSFGFNSYNIGGNS